MSPDKRRREGDSHRSGKSTRKKQPENAPKQRVDRNAPDQEQQTKPETDGLTPFRGAGLTRSPFIRSLKPPVVAGALQGENDYARGNTHTDC
jgi:hypothetical protein